MSAYLSTTIQRSTADCGGDDDIIQMAHDLNPHERAPDVIRNAHTEYRKMKPAVREQDERVVDFGRGLTAEQNQSIRVVDHLDSVHLRAVFATFEDQRRSDLSSSSETIPSQIPVYEHDDVPGR